MDNTFIIKAALGACCTLLVCANAQADLTSSLYSKATNKAKTVSTNTTTPCP